VETEGSGEEKDEKEGEKRREERESEAGDSLTKKRYWKKKVFFASKGCCEGWSWADEEVKKNKKEQRARPLISNTENEG